MEPNNEHVASHIRAIDNNSSFYSSSVDRNNLPSISGVWQDMYDFEKSDVKNMYDDPNDPYAPTPLHTMQIDQTRQTTIDHNSMTCCLESIWSKHVDVATNSSNAPSNETIINCSTYSQSLASSYLNPYQARNDMSKMATTTTSDRLFLQPSVTGGTTTVPVATTGEPRFDFATSSQPLDEMINFGIHTVSRSPVTITTTLINAAYKTNHTKTSAKSVPPRQGGNIVKLNDNDVLCGRGGRINSYIGNVRFRYAIAYCQPDYLDPELPKAEKGHIAAMIVQRIRTLGGRFLNEGTKNGTWYEIGDCKAIRKTCQAIREYGPNTRSSIRAKLKKSIANNQVPDEMIAPNHNDYANYTAVSSQPNIATNNFINTNDRWSLPNMYLSGTKEPFLQPRTNFAALACTEAATTNYTSPSGFDDSNDEIRRLSGRFDYVFGHVFHPPSSTYTMPQVSVEEDDDVKVAAIPPPIPHRRPLIPRRRSLSESTIGTFRY
jgi:hypothetical protein